MYGYGLIGNCQTAALVSNKASIDWLCFPRPDSPPVLGRLLDDKGGFFSIEPAEYYQSGQSYIGNTNILVTTFVTKNGDEFTVTDFCPRFLQYGRVFRPNAIFRIIEPKKGIPYIKALCKPIDGWSKNYVPYVRGNSHLRFDFRDDHMRLTTNMPLTYLIDEIPFLLNEPVYFALTWGFGLEDDIIRVSRDFLNQTINYWHLWVKNCSIPTLFQKEAIRSALTLKLHCYEDTGAILASLTTSLPEEQGSGRNWDYRYCWLRDSYFIVSAFNNLGLFEEMEGFLKFLLDVAFEKEQLSPVYKLDKTLPLPEFIHDNWSGYKGNTPVRSNNDAAGQIQNDIYGEMILTITPLFLDERFIHMRTKAHYDLLDRLVQLCVNSIGKPDDGVWEFRNNRKEHSFTNFMCWAGLDRAGKILKSSTINFDKEKGRAVSAIKKNIRDGVLRNNIADDSLDASLLLLPILRYPDRELCVKTVMSIYESLSVKIDGNSSAFIYRYNTKDDFGEPQSSFVACSFWLVHALARIGKTKLAENLLQQNLTSANELMLLSEHYEPVSKEQRGNFPQAYSHVGLINSIFSVSPSWDEII